MFVVLANATHVPGIVFRALCGLVLLILTAPYEVDSINSGLWMRKLKHREIKSLAQGCSAHQWGRQN